MGIVEGESVVIVRTERVSTLLRVFPDTLIGVEADSDAGVVSTVVRRVVVDTSARLDRVDWLPLIGDP